VKPANGYYWPTSDNPVVKLNYYSPDNYDLKGGWGVNKGNIFFPIGPEHAMFVQIGDRPIQKNTRLSENMTQELIKFIAENSHRKIFSHAENNDLPILKRRVVDLERLSRENKEMREWHKINTMMEREYIASNRNA
jgi:ATP phosphoribosyltransferase